MLFLQRLEEQDVALSSNSDYNRTLLLVVMSNATCAMCIYVI